MPSMENGAENELWQCDAYDSMCGHPHVLCPNHSHPRWPLVLAKSKVSEIEPLHSGSTFKGKKIILM